MTKPRKLYRRFTYWRDFAVPYLANWGSGIKKGSDLDTYMTVDDYLRGTRNWCLYWAKREAKKKRKV